MDKQLFWPPKSKEIPKFWTLEKMREIQNFRRSPKYDVEPQMFLSTTDISTDKQSNSAITAGCTPTLILNTQSIIFDTTSAIIDMSIDNNDADFEIFACEEEGFYLDLASILDPIYSSRCLSSDMNCSFYCITNPVTILSNLNELNYVSKNISREMFSIAAEYLFMVIKHNIKYSHWTYFITYFGTFVWDPGILIYT